MLIALHDDIEILERKTIAEGIASHVNGKTRIYNPKNIEEFIAVVKTHKAVDNLILLSSHYDYYRKISIAEWRAIEIEFDLYGGTVWGGVPPQEAMTYISNTSVDYEKIVLTAEYNKNRSKLIKKMSGVYFGRASSDPHTLIVGFVPSLPSLSVHSQYLLRSFPEEWWKGVGFVRSGGRSEKIIKWYESSNLISLGDAAHMYLTDLDLPHGAAPGMKDLFKKTMDTDKALGLFLRETARTGKNIDNRDWRS